MSGRRSGRIVVLDRLNIDAGRDHSAILWAVLWLELWFRMFVDGDLSPDQSLDEVV